MEAWAYLGEAGREEKEYKVISAQGKKRRCFGSADTLEGALKIARAVIDLELDKAPGIYRNGLNSI